jgi:hypothetical protein
MSLKPLPPPVLPRDTFLLVKDEVDNLAADKEHCYVLVNTTTRRLNG